MALFLVTGGCGFIGSHLAVALVARGHTVRIIDDLSTGRREHAPAGAEVIIGDITDPACLALGMDGVDGCFHLAAIASVQRSVEDWRRTNAVNLAGTIGVFDVARRARGGRPVPVVYASSAAVYGDNIDVPLAETAATRPRSAYGVDKLACELHARIATEVHGVPTTGLRFFNVYGPRQDRRSPYSGVISVFYDRLSRGQPIEIHGDGRQMRDFVYVDDVVTFLLAAMSTAATADAPRVYNTCTGVGTSVEELARTIAELCGTELQVERCPPRPGDIRVSVGDPGRARAELGCMATVSVRQGLERMMAYDAAA